MAVITFTPSSLQLVPNETVTVEWQSDTGLALVWQTSADESVATVAPLQNQGTSGTFSVTGVANGSTTIDINGMTPDMQAATSAPLPVTVGTVEDESYLNKRGLTHFWENIDEIKQDKLTAGAGISITGNTISATGGGTADSVAWGHITGSMSNQTDLTTALAAKANSADLATVATSGSYNDLSNKPTVPEIKKRTGASTTTNITPLYVAGDGTTTTPMALKTHGDTRNGSFAYININEPTNSITEAYAGGYVWDEDEDWWRKMSEVRLALYSDIPTVPTVNNATLTIQKNGTTVNTFTANASSNVTANITVPTATSDLTNDSGFIDEVSTITNARIDEIMGVA